jgi:hypothetical protein
VELSTEEPLRIGDPEMSTQSYAPDRHADLDVGPGDERLGPQGA